MAMRDKNNRQRKAMREAKSKKGLKEAEQKLKMMRAARPNNRRK
jgi:hypothetical protein